MEPEEYEDRKRVILRESTFITTDREVRQIIETEDKIANLEISTRAEVHFTGKENIEGFVSLVNMFIRTMLITSSKPCLINVNNRPTKHLDDES